MRLSYSFHEWHPYDSASMHAVEFNAEATTYMHLFQQIKLNVILEPCRFTNCYRIMDLQINKCRDIISICS